MSEVAASPEADARRLPLAPLAGCAACAAGVLLLAWLAHAGGGAARFDQTVLNRALAAAGGSAALPGARALVHLGDPGPVLALTALACFGATLAGRLREAIGAIVLVAGAGATTLVLKELLADERFDPALLHHPIVATAYPSGHSTALAAVAFAVALVTAPRWRALAALLAGAPALLAGACLVALGDHFPSDVVGGWLVAGFWLCAVVAALRAAAQALPTADTLTG
jgi:membrane-associated phospholipid phosphatase